MNRAKLAELVEQRAEVYGKMAALLTRSADGSMSQNDSEAYDRLERKFDDLDGQIKAGEEQLGLSGTRVRKPDSTEPAGRSGSDIRDVAYGDLAVNGSRRQSVVLDREARMADWIEGRAGRSDYSRDDVRNFSIGRAIRAAATGDWSDADVEHRALSEGIAAAGGFMVPEVLTGVFIDLVRAKTRVLEAGATTVPLSSDEHSIPRLATGGTAAWRNENTAVFESEGTFERVTFRPKTLARTTLLSFELAEDMLPGAAERIDGEIAGSLALELDRVALRGSGTSPEPRGVRNQTGVEVQTTLGANGATPTNYDFLVKAVTGVKRDNFSPNAVLYSTRTEETLALLKDSGGQPLERPAILGEVAELSTNQIPDNLTTGTSTDTSEAYAAQWNELLIGVRPAIGVRFVREHKGETLQYRITCYLRADVQLAHPAAFAVCPGIRP